MRAAGALFFVVSLVALPQPASAERERQVLLFLLDGISYPEALQDEVLGGLARAGGIGLMTNAGASGPAADVALGAGAAIHRLFPEPGVTPTSNGVLHVEGVPALRQSAQAGLLAQRLTASGRTVGYLTRCCELGQRGSLRGVLATVNREGSVDPGLVLDHRGYFGLHGVPQPYRARFARADLVVVDLDQWMPNVQGIDYSVRRQMLNWVRESAGQELLVILAVASPTEAIEERTGKVTPLIMARGEPRRLLKATGPPAGLTSDTTRHGGLVSNVDVAPTILEFLDVPVPEAMTGSPIRIEGGAPTDLYERAVEYRRVALPVGLVVLGLGIGSLVLGVVILLVGIRSGVVRGTVAVIGLFAVSLMVALVPASVLSTLELPVLLLGLGVVAAALLTAALAAGRRDHAVAVAVVAGAGLAALVIDGLLGWPTEITPLLGGGALLGVRFSGLGNSAAGIVLAGAVLTAALLRPWPGIGLLVGAALFAGLPFLGSDLGGGITLFAVAGLWYAWRVRERLDLAAWAVTGLATVAGAALLVAAHAAWATATHVSRAVEAGGLLGTFADRLISNLRATSDIWPVWLTVIGLPIWLLVAWRPPGPWKTSTNL